MLKTLKKLQSKLQKLMQEHNAYYSNGYICTNNGRCYGDECTVYYSEKGKCYHLRDCQYYRITSYHKHILTPPTAKTPCSVCHPLPALWLSVCKDLQAEIDRLTKIKGILSKTSYDYVLRLSRMYYALEQATQVYNESDNTVSYNIQKSTTLVAE